MRESHEHLRITENEWSVMYKHLRDTFDKFKIPEHEQQELFAIVQSTKPDIVMG